MWCFSCKSTHLIGRTLGSSIVREYHYCIACMHCSCYYYYLYFGLCCFLTYFVIICIFFLPSLHTFFSFTCLIFTSFAILFIVLHASFFALGANSNYDSPTVGSRTARIASDRVSATKEGGEPALKY